jgi:hypothetical protein
VTDDYDATSSELIFIWQEGASEERCDAEDCEQVGGNESILHLFRLRAAGQSKSCIGV